MPLIFLTLLACSTVPSEQLSWRESWELLGSIDDGGLLDAQITVGNTGLLRGQGHIRLQRWSRMETPILFGRDYPPQVIDIDNASNEVLLQTEGLARNDERWSLRATTGEIGLGSNLNAVVHLTPNLDLQTQNTWQEHTGEWRERAMVTRGEISGWVDADSRGGLVHGYGVLLHRSGDKWPELPRRGIFIINNRVSIGIDVHGSEELKWIWIKGESLDAAQLSVSQDAQAITLAHPEMHVQITRGSIGGSRQPHHHLLGFEKFIAGMITTLPTRTVQNGQAKIHWEDETYFSPAILLNVGG